MLCKVHYKCNGDRFKIYVNLPRWHVKQGTKWAFCLLSWTGPGNQTHLLVHHVNTSYRRGRNETQVVASVTEQGCIWPLFGPNISATVISVSSKMAILPYLSPVFPVGGGANPPLGGHQHTNKLHEIKKILVHRRGGACTGSAPLRSATVQVQEVTSEMRNICNFDRYLYFCHHVTSHTIIIKS